MRTSLGVLSNGATILDFRFNQNYVSDVRLVCATFGEESDRGTKIADQVPSRFEPSHYKADRIDRHVDSPLLCLWNYGWECSTPAAC